MPNFPKRLSKAPTSRVEGTLVRAVAAAALFPGGEPASPDFLFTSGKPNRFNLSGVECLYFSESEATALAEYRRQFQGFERRGKQPVTLFFAEVRLQHALDLVDAETRRILGVTLEDLASNWGYGLPPTTAQRLGEAVAAQTRVSAIRYRSVAAIKAGTAGFNVVIFKPNVRAPDFVQILGPTKKPLQKLR
ncbi:MAG: RES domain-containing protein [Verrucomicrobia bacterium]|nr:RES domain-containing protein [Verrucomicrobiota bacterium]